MAFTDNLLFLRTLAPQPGQDPHAIPRERLRSALFSLRERAQVLAGEIHRDLPDFTVHDITHLDALWEMADLIAGPEYPLNPMEAFALGAVFLIHDLGLGLAAYPGGLAELKNGPGWQDALSTYLRKHLERIPTTEEFASPPPEVERMAVQERLRVLHAEQAERLALASWRHKGGPEYNLIEDPDLRQAIGPLLGKIAHSHWWPVSRLGSEFSTIRGALSTCPGDWTLDPLKIAMLLRTADAGHLDSRRAPGFLIAIRRPEGIPENHWRFQNRLLKPRVEEDRLVYTTATPFPPEEVDAWWLCEETLRMVDREFHQVDALLADRGGLRRLRVRSVAGVESPSRLQNYIGISGWTPVDARLHVSNVADIARKLGGEHLYGDVPTVPLRELIQNASDAVRARRLLDDRPSNWGRISVQLGRDDQGPWVEVADTGVGMSEALLTGPLLDFGTTYWDSGMMHEEHEGLWAKGFEPTGRFGIGFFSVFMWGGRVRVTTQRYDDAPIDTRILEFKAGPDARPFVRRATPEERFRDGGTRVRVWLLKEPCEKGGILFSNQWPVELNTLCAWLAPALDVDLYVENEGRDELVVAASDWITIESSKLLSRLRLAADDAPGINTAPSLALLVSANDDVLGRAAVAESGAATVTVGGLRGGYISGALGIFVGSPKCTATRTQAKPLADSSLLAAWSSRQADLIAAGTEDLIVRLKTAKYICWFGGKTGKLPIVIRGEQFLTYDELSLQEDLPEEIEVAPILGPFLGSVYKSTLDKLVVSGDFFAPLPHNQLDVIRDALAMAWGCCSIDISIRLRNENLMGFGGVILRKP